MTTVPRKMLSGSRCQERHTKAQTGVQNAAPAVAVPLHPGPHVLLCTVTSTLPLYLVPNYLLCRTARSVYSGRPWTLDVSLLYSVLVALSGSVGTVAAVARNSRRRESAAI